MDIVLYSAIGIALLTIFYFVFPTRKAIMQNRVIRRQADEIKLQNKILEEQNEQLKLLNLEKSQLISVVSHDLKSPLNRVFALTNLLTMEGDNLSRDQQEYIERIHIVIAEGLNLIRNLLDLRAIEDDVITLRIESIALDQFLKDQLRTFRQEATRKGIKLKGKFGKEVLHSDRQYLSRVFDNLLSNAIKYCRLNGTVSLTYQFTHDQVVFAIADEGPGIEPDEQKDLFKKYQVLSSKATGGESSTGLGLSIAKSLVQKLGGEIWQQNNEQVGSTFYLSLPLNPGNYSSNR